PFVLLDTNNGPIIIEDGTTIGALTVIEGSCYIGPDCKIWPRTQLADVSFGGVNRVMGQLEETIIQGYSNKQHYGFIGGAYLGSWINLGAGTTNSNLKNNYGNVRVVVNGESVDTGNRFVGTFMGDHAKTAIGTMLNTGTRVGLSANVFGSDRPSKNVPSFAWGLEGQRYDLDKLLENMNTVKGRRDQELTDAERELVKLRFKEAG
ncbi:MAG: hypothetical protein KAU50_10260, partial [Candidatus Marinimicrobia bacterium]|nr:hypothetical protein [Candidatus Neomarinimicrobiota bacterium]